VCHSVLVKVQSSEQGKRNTKAACPEEKMALDEAPGKDVFGNQVDFS